LNTPGFFVVKPEALLVWLNAFYCLVNGVFMKFVNLIGLTICSAAAAEQDLLLTSDFVLNAGATQTQWLSIDKPMGTDVMVLAGFDPVQALSVSCVLRLYDRQTKLLGSYNCSIRKTYRLTPPLLSTDGFRAQIEVTNSNFSKGTSEFSVVSRFKFISSE
jgi:hypothetical protein